MKRLLLLCLLAIGSYASAQAPCPATTGNVFAATNFANCFSLTNTFALGVNLGNILIANLPPAASNVGTIITIRDGNSTTDCTVGSGTTINLCQSNGSTWAVISGGGGGIFSSVTLNGTANQIVGPGQVFLGNSGVFSIASPFIFPGKATTIASAAGGAGFNLPSGAAPSSPVSGDLFNNANALQFFNGSSTLNFVNSVALTLPAEFSVAGSPITTSGTLAVTKATQTANTVYAGPSSGGALAPSFRSIVPADLPAANAQNVAGPLLCQDSSGSGTAQLCSTNPSFTPSYPVCLIYTTTTASTGALTLNVNSTSAFTVQHYNGNAIASGDIKANVPTLACLDNASHWRLQF